MYDVVRPTARLSRLVGGVTLVSTLLAGGPVAGAPPVPDRALAAAPEHIAHTMGLHRSRRALFAVPVMWWARVLCVALIAMFALGQRVAPARAAGAQVSEFFTVSAVDAYPFYNTHDGVPPAPSNTRAFPSQAASVYFYYAYSGASPGTTRFQAVLYDTSGNLLTQDRVYPATRAGGQFMNSFSSFADGDYRLVLYVDGSEARSTTFTVGQGVGLLFFDTISHAAYAASGRGQDPAPRTVSFPAGTRVCYTVGYQGATSGPSYLVTMYDHTGKVRNTDSQSFNDSSGNDSTCFSGSQPLEPGAYFLGLQIDGSTIAITSFSIERSGLSPIVITTFYTLPAETAGFTHSPPRANKYRAGIKVINYFFHFRGIAPDKLKHTITLDVPDGITVLADNSSTSSLLFDQTANSGSVLNSVAVRQPFPPGVYRLELVVNGATLATTTFTIVAGS
jgi:hypothetical protein